MVAAATKAHAAARKRVPSAAAMSFILMAIILVLVLLYARAVGSDKLTGTA